MTAYTDQEIEKILREQRAKEIAKYLRWIADNLDKGEEFAVVLMTRYQHRNGPPVTRHGEPSQVLCGCTIEIKLD